MDYSLRTLQQYQVNQAGNAEVVRQRLYDYQLYPTAGQAQLTFFSLPLGQGLATAAGAAAGSAKTYADTNMEVGGALPRPKAFLVESIEVSFEPGSVSTANTFTEVKAAIFNATAALALLEQIDDVDLIRQSGWLEFYIGSKTYIWESPLGSFPMKTWLGLDSALSMAGTNAQPAALGLASAKWAGRPYYLDPPITLESLQNFAIYLKWPGVVATPSGFNGRIGVILDGVIFRNAQ